MAEWPPDSPLSFVLMLAPRTRGKLGEMLIAQIAADSALTVAKAESVAYDVRVGPARCEVKFSTEDPPRFQQVRDPRETGATKVRLPRLHLGTPARPCLLANPGRDARWPHGRWLRHGATRDERHEVVPTVAPGERRLRWVPIHLRGLREGARRDRRLDPARRPPPARPSPPRPRQPCC